MDRFCSRPKAHKVDLLTEQLPMRSRPRVLLSSRWRCREFPRLDQSLWRSHPVHAPSSYPDCPLGPTCLALGSSRVLGEDSVVRWLRPPAASGSCPKGSEDPSALLQRLHHEDEFGRMRRMSRMRNQSGLRWPGC